MSDNWEMTRPIDEIGVVDAPSAIRKLRALVEYERATNSQLSDRMLAEGIPWPKIWEKPAERPPEKPFLEIPVAFFADGKPSELVQLTTTKLHEMACAEREGRIKGALASELEATRDAYAISEYELGLARKELGEARKREFERILSIITGESPEDFIRNATRVPGKWDEPDLRALLEDEDGDQPLDTTLRG